MPPRKLQPDRPPEPELSLTPLEATQGLYDISVTERAAFRSCRRRWLLDTLENLQPRNFDEIALEFGSAMHTALELFYSGGTQEEVLKVIDDWCSEMGKRDLTQEQWEEVLDHTDLGEIMLKGYFRFDQVSNVRLGRPLAVEGVLLGPDLEQRRPEGYPSEAAVRRHASRRMMVPIVDPETKQPILFNGQVAYLTGRIDLLSERKTPKSGLWVTDHKNLASPPSDKALDFDDQVTGYCYIVWRWTGVIPRGVVYNVLLKNAPKDPRMVKGKRKNEGLVLSTAKDQQTTPDLYRQALKDHGLMVGNRVTSEKHAECLAALLARGWDPFFRRYEITRNEYQLLMFEERLAAEYQDMRRVRDSPEMLYPNPTLRTCPYCSVRSICLAMEDGSDFEDVIESGFVVGPDRKAK